jgi:hypothetical protein
MADEFVKLQIRVNEQIYLFEVNEYWLWVKRQPDSHTIHYERLTDQAAKAGSLLELGKMMLFGNKTGCRAYRLLDKSAYSCQ